MLLILGLFNSIFSNSNNELVNHDYLDNQSMTIAYEKHHYPYLQGNMELSIPANKP